MNHTRYTHNQNYNKTGWREVKLLKTTEVTFFLHPILSVARAGAGKMLLTEVFLAFWPSGHPVFYLSASHNMYFLQYKCEVCFQKTVFLIGLFFLKQTSHERSSVQRLIMILAPLIFSCVRDCRLISRVFRNSDVLICNLMYRYVANPGIIYCWQGGSYDNTPCNLVNKWLLAQKDLKLKFDSMYVTDEH